jgi:hypothetical protein
VKKIIYRSSITALFLILCSTDASADSFSGQARYNYNSVIVEQDGNRESDTRTFRENYFLNYNRPVTPAISYQLYVRISEFQTRTTDNNNNISLNYSRMIEPSIDVNLRNSFYNLSSGYRRQEDWSDTFSSGDIRYIYPYQLLTSDDRLGDNDRETTELFYARLHFIPQDLPSLSLDYDRLEFFDHLSPRNIDRTSDVYSIKSTYRTAYDVYPGDVRARYYLNYTHSIDKKPDDITNKIVSDSFNLNYAAGHTGSLRTRNVNYSVSYRGNYSRSEDKRFVSQTGSFLTKRAAIGGFHAGGSAVKPDVDILPSEGSLVDNDFSTSTGIDISTLITGQYQNLGIRVSGTKPVDTIYVYVNQDVTGDVLAAVSGWKAYSSNTNINVPGTWTERAIQSVSVSLHDLPDSIYRFEIKLSLAETASYFKVLNVLTASTVNVSVTEIEAYGTDDILNTETTETSDSMNQGLEFRASSQLYTNVVLALHYSLDRFDQNPDSVFNSIGGIFKNIFSNDVNGGDADLRSVITRGYGATATWEAHRLISASLRLQRSENFDNIETLDFASNSYNLSFHSAPLPTLDATLSFLKNDTYQFDSKDNESYSMLLSVGSQLHREVYMITDAGFSKSDSLTNNTTAETYLLDGSINANLNRKLSGSMNYGLSHTSSSGTSSDSKNASLTFSYRPARLINVSSNFRILDTDGIMTTSEGLFADWIPLPTLRINLNYNHTNSDASPSRSDTFSSYLIWYITKFADLRFTYTYSETVDIDRTNSHGYNSFLNCRF